MQVKLLAPLPQEQPKHRRNIRVTRNSAVYGFKMLVVEDNAINQRVMKRQLETRGCTVLTANNGLEAVEFIQQSSLNRHPGSDAKEIEICFMVFIYLWMDLWGIFWQLIKHCEMLVMNGMVASQQIRHMQVEGILTRHLPILGVSTNVRGAQGIILFEWSIVVSSPTDNWVYSPSNERLWNGMSLSIHNQYFPPINKWSGRRNLEAVHYQSIGSKCNFTCQFAICTGLEQGKWC